MTAFFFFSSKMRAALREAEPTLKPTEVAKRLGQLWKELPDDERTKYLEACRVDGDQWDEQWSAYRQTDEFRALQDRARDESACTAKRARDDAEIVPPPSSHLPDGAMDTNEQFEVDNPEWKLVDGRWRCEWDTESDEEADEVVTGGHRRPRPKLGSLAVDYFDEELGMRGARSDMETQASARSRSAFFAP
jgi:hypothetical protein